MEPHPADGGVIFAPETTGIQRGEAGVLDTPHQPTKATSARIVFRWSFKFLIWMEALPWSASLIILVISPTAFSQPRFLSQAARYWLALL